MGREIGQQLERIEGNWQDGDPMMNDGLNKMKDRINSLIDEQRGARVGDSSISVNVIVNGVLVIRSFVVK